MKALQVLLLATLIIGIVGATCGDSKSSSHTRAVSEPVPTATQKLVPTATPVPPPGPDQIPAGEMTLDQKMEYLEYTKVNNPNLVDEVMQKLGLLRDFMLRAKNDFGASIDQYDAQTQALEQEFEVGKNTLLTFRDAVKQAQDKYPEFQKVYEEWDKIGRQVQELEDKIASLEAMSETFYQAAKDYAQTITDEELRTGILTKLEESETNYSARLETAQLSVAKLRDAKTKVDDTMKALEISYSLEVAEEKMDEVFAEIDELVALVMKDLETLSQESRDLLATF